MRPSLGRTGAVAGAAVTVVAAVAATATNVKNLGVPVLRSVGRGVSLDVPRLGQKGPVLIPRERVGASFVVTAEASPCPTPPAQSRALGVRSPRSARQLPFSIPPPSSPGPGLPPTPRRFPSAAARRA